jgi:hypothetical protein
MFIARSRLAPPSPVRGAICGWSDAALDRARRHNSSHSYKYCAPDGAGKRSVISNQFIHGALTSRLKTPWIH